MQGADWDQAIVDYKTCGALDKPHPLFSVLRREDPVH